MWWNDRAAHVGVVSKRGSNARTGRQAQGDFLVIAYGQRVSQRAIDGAWGGGRGVKTGLNRASGCKSHKPDVPDPMSLEKRIWPTEQGLLTSAPVGSAGKIGWVDWGCLLLAVSHRPGLVHGFRIRTIVPVIPYWTTESDGLQVSTHGC